MIFVVSHGRGTDGVRIQGARQVDVHLVVKDFGPGRKLNHGPAHGIGKNVVTALNAETFQQFYFFKFLFTGGILVITDFHLHIIIHTQVQGTRLLGAGGSCRCPVSFAVKDGITNRFAVAVQISLIVFIRVHTEVGGIGDTCTGANHMADGKNLAVRFKLKHSVNGRVVGQAHARVVIVGVM